MNFEQSVIVVSSAARASSALTSPRRQLITIATNILISTFVMKKK